MAVHDISLTSAWGGPGSPPGPPSGGYWQRYYVDPWRRFWGITSYRWITAAGVRTGRVRHPWRKAEEKASEVWAGLAGLALGGVAGWYGVQSWWGQLLIGGGAISAYTGINVYGWHPSTFTQAFMVGVTAGALGARGYAGWKAGKVVVDELRQAAADLRALVDALQAPVSAWGWLGDAAGSLGTAFRKSGFVTWPLRF